MTTRPRSAGDVTAHDADAKSDDSKPKASESSSSEKGSSSSGSSGTAYLNTTGGPVVYDKAGHQVDAGAWTPEINLDAVGKSARQAGHLKPQSAL